MDFQNAILLIGAVFGIVELAKKVFPADWVTNSRFVVAVVVAIGQAVTFLVANTAWAHEQVIGDKPLDELNTASLILVGLLASGAAVLGDNVLWSVKNIGDNQPEE